MATQSVWGLDIGNSAIKAVKMVRDGDEAHVVEFDIIDIAGTADDDEADRSQRVSKSLSTLTENHAFGKDPVYLSLPGNLCLFREFNLPPGSESKLAELVQYEARQQIPFPLDQVELAWERFDDPSGTGVGVEMIVVRKNIIEEILQLTDQFNLNVQGISVAPVALFNFINYEYQPTGATLILDAGHKSTDFIVVRDRHMYSRTIHIAGRELTRVLENKFKVAFERAEDLKRNIAQSKQAKKILSVIEPTLRQLGSEIQRTVGFWKSKARGQKLTHGFLLGHTFRLPGMAEQIAGSLREASFTIVEGVKRVRLNRAINADEFANEFPTLAVTIGLGLQGLDLSEWKANLLPKSRITENKIDEKRSWGVACAAMALIAVCCTFFLASAEQKRMTELQAKITEANADVNKYKKDLRRATVTAGLEFKKKRLQSLSRVGVDRGRMSKIFGAMISLNDVNGQPYFGANQKVYLNDVYVSRVPFSYKQGEGWAPIAKTYNNSRSEILAGSEHLNEKARIYQEMQSVGDLNKIPLNERPNAPLTVILSLECKGERTTVVRGITEALKRIPEIDAATIGCEAPGRIVRREARPNFDKAGNPIDGKNIYGKAKSHPFSPLHFVFRWRSKDMPDVAPKKKLALVKKKK